MQGRTLGLSAKSLSLQGHHRGRGAKDKAISHPNVRLQDRGPGSAGWQLTQATRVHKAQDLMQGQ